MCATNCDVCFQALSYASPSAATINATRSVTTAASAAVSMTYMARASAAKSDMERNKNI